MPPLHKRRAAIFGASQIRVWPVTPPAAFGSTGVNTIYSDYMSIPDPKPSGTGWFAVPNLKIEGIGSLAGSVEFWNATDKLSESSITGLDSFDIAGASGATASASGTISGSGASGTVTGSWASSTLGTYDSNKKYVLTTFSASVHAYGGIPAAEVTAGITSIDIELADAAYNVIKTISIACAITSHDVPAGGGVYGNTDGTISLSLTDLEVLTSWTGVIAYARVKINWTYDHAFGSGTVACGATITGIANDDGAAVQKDTLALPTTSVSATNTTVTQTFAASIPAGIADYMLRYRNVNVSYSYKGYWAPVAPSSGSSTGCGSVTVSSDYLNGSTSITLTAAAGVTACTQLSSTVRNIRDTGSLVVSGSIEEYSCLFDGTIEPYKLAIVAGGVQGEQITRLRYRLSQTKAVNTTWRGTVVGIEMYQLPAPPGD